jgi:small-conductance mechanosensitive channel
MDFDAAALFSRLRAWLAWAPDWAAGAILLAVAVVAAVAVHAVLHAIAQRAVPREHTFLRRLIERTRRPARLALVIFFVAAALSAAPFDATAANAIGRALLVAFIVLVGWSAAIAVNLIADFYLRRFSLESEDNLLARKHFTQVRILERATETLVFVITIAGVLMTFDAVRTYGVSLFASAGVAGIVAGLAARPMLSNLIAGIQIAISQPIRLDDRVLVEGEFGTVEEITSTYVVIRLWDLRRMIVPLTYFIEKPFQNWTRDTSKLIGAVFVYVDYTVPVARVRAKLSEIVAESKLWDRDLVKLQVTDVKDNVVELRAIMGARTAGDAFDLRCEVREKMIDFLQAEFPHALPRVRQTTVEDPAGPRPAAGKKSGKRPARPRPG